MTETILFCVLVIEIYLELGAWNLVLSFSDLSFSINDKFSCCQLLQSHGAKGVEFGGADPDLCTEAQLESVIESCRGIGQDTRGVDFF